MPFPTERPRRLRRSDTLRRMVRETHLSVDDLIFPLFVCPGTGVKDEISSMPGNYRWSVDLLPAEMEEVAALGVPAVLLFGIPESKDPLGTGAYAEDGIVQQAVRAIRQAVP
ncbi:MAG: porphobilinogen synthase, partial [Armatimonadetes bacterium]|nr:porphobilinogen synthase [Armatimonadota bacterium]